MRRHSTPFNMKIFATLGDICLDGRDIRIIAGFCSNQTVAIGIKTWLILIMREVVQFLCEKMFSQAADQKPENIIAIGLVSHEQHKTGDAVLHVMNREDSQIILSSRNRL